MQVAHLDHDAENWEVSYERLLSLCQLCHLKNDREHSMALIQKAMSKERVKPVTSDSMTKPQMKIMIKHLTAQLDSQNRDLISRDLKIKHLLSVIKGESEYKMEGIRIIIKEETCKKNHNPDAELLERIKDLEYELSKWKHKPPKLKK